jgi:hypothetical protein
MWKASTMPSRTSLTLSNKSSLPARCRPKPIEHGRPALLRGRRAANQAQPFTSWRRKPSVTRAVTFVMKLSDQRVAEDRLLGNLLSTGCG